VLQSGNEAFAAPKLDCAAIRKPFGFADGIVVVSASQRLVPIEIAVEPNGICPVVCQVQAPSVWCDDRFMVGAVSAKIDSLFKARFVWFNPRQYRWPPASRAGWAKVTDEFVHWASSGHRAGLRSCCRNSELIYSSMSRSFCSRFRFHLTTAGRGGRPTFRSWVPSRFTQLRLLNGTIDIGSS
jgi:hypothetical protein